MKCKHCHKRPVEVQSREICRRCYRRLRYHGRVEEYPKKDMFRKRLLKRYGAGITLHFLWCRNNIKGITLSYIARKYEFSRERASQIYQKLFGKKYSKL